jgi:hypothetical protein
VRSHVNVDESCISVFGQHESSLALYQEVNGRDVVALKVNVLVFGVETWLQKRANPCNKGGGPSLEAANLLVSLLMDE